MVTSAVEDLVAMEVVDGGVMARIRRRMRELEERFAADLDHEILKGRGRRGAPAGQVTPVNGAAIEGIEDTAIGS
jgi:hypothetical protein